MKITLTNVSKCFGHQCILKNINLIIEPGEMVGFLGRNGAGKTTLMRLLTTYYAPSKGQVIFSEGSSTLSEYQVRLKIGYLPENPPLYPTMTVFNYLNFTASIKAVEKRKIAKRVVEVLQECQLMDVKDRHIAVLSKGYKQRVGIAQAIIHNPEVLILDEPTNGLDPVQIKYVRDLIKNVEKKRTVILSTHILPEIESLAERVLIINQGRLVRDVILDDEQSVHKASGGSQLEQLFFEQVAPVKGTSNKETHYDV